MRETEVYKAALRGNLHALRAALQACPGHLHEPSGDGGDTPLIIAANNGHTACLAALLAASADVHTRGSDGDTALHAAARNGHAACVEALLQAGADVSARNAAEEQPIHEAALICTACISALLAAGADVEAAGKGGSTALQVAAMEGHEECLRCLLAAGAKADNRTPRSGLSALIRAAAKGSAGCVAALIASGADVNLACDGTSALAVAAASGREACVRHLLAAGAAVDAVEFAKLTPLQWAAKKGELGIVTALLEAAADIEAGGPDGMTPLLCACTNGHPDVVTALLAAGADTEAKSATDHGFTALLFAAKGGDVRLLHALLAAGADTEATEAGTGCTALLLAVHHGQEECASALISAGANVNAARADDQRVALFHCKDMHMSLLEQLLAAGADVHSPDNQGNSPLHWAAYKGWDECLGAMLQAGGPSEQRNALGYAPMACAAVNGNTECIRLLAAAGADVTARTGDNKTPRQLAQPFHAAARLLMGLEMSSRHKAASRSGRQVQQAPSQQQELSSEAVAAAAAAAAALLEEEEQQAQQQQSKAAAKAAKRQRQREKQRQQAAGSGSQAGGSDTALADQQAAEGPSVRTAGVEHAQSRESHLSAPTPAPIEEAGSSQQQNQQQMAQQQTEPPPLHQQMPVLEQHQQQHLSRMQHQQQQQQQQHVPAPPPQPQQAAEQEWTSASRRGRASAGHSTSTAHSPDAARAVRHAAEADSSWHRPAVLEAALPQPQLPQRPVQQAARQPPRASLAPWARTTAGPQSPDQANPLPLPLPLPPPHLESLSRLNRGASGDSAARGTITLTVHACLLEEAVCPISHEPMEDPVVAADGHLYERREIEAPRLNRGASGGSGARGTITLTLDASLLDEAVCPISHEPMEDPVLAADGHTYERREIEAWIARQAAAGQPPCSPLTNLPLEHTALAPNRMARAVIAAMRTAGLLH